MCLCGVGIIFLISNNSVDAQQTFGNVEIINVQEIEPGGTATVTTTGGGTMTLTLPQGESATLSVQTSDVQSPTSGGEDILFLDVVLTLTLEPPDVCLGGCDLTFTFTDDHLAAAGEPNAEDISIFQDTDQDGTFESLPTILVDGAPSPYTVLATITSTSFFGIGVLDAETFCGKSLEQWEAEGANIVFGTEENDRLRGGNDVDVIIGLGGNDRILGKDGNDCLVGGPGNDRIVGGKGDDIIQGNDGKDRLHGSKGDDFVEGGNGKDRITGNNGSDLIDGGNDDDEIIGNKGNDVLFGSNGDDKIRGGNGDDRIDGGADFDDCEGGSGSDIIVNCEDDDDEDDDDEDDEDDDDDDEDDDDEDDD